MASDFHLKHMCKTQEATGLPGSLLSLSISDPLASHMEMVTEIVVPTVFTLCILLSAVLLMFLLRRQS